jgi:DNA-binding NarL/FixJ family response regulator
MNLSRTYNVLVVDDNELVRSSLEMIIEAEANLQVTATVANGVEALAHIALQKPDIVLLDMQMPEMDGLECISCIRKLDVDLPILILTTFDEKDYIINGLASGANGYLLKGMEFEKLIPSIHDVLKRQFVLPAQIAAKLSQYLLSTLQKVDTNLTTDSLSTSTASIHFPPKMFTKKEQEILLLLNARLPNREIAEQLQISDGTLRNHLTNIFEKLEVSNRYDAVRTIQTFTPPSV